MTFFLYIWLCAQCQPVYVDWYYSDSCHTAGHAFIAKTNKTFGAGYACIPRTPK